MNGIKQDANRAALLMTAKTIVDGQPIVNGVKLLDESAKEILRIILEYYDGNEYCGVSIKKDGFPKKYHLPTVLSTEFEKLKLYGMILRYRITSTIPQMCEITLSTQGLTYFNQTEKLYRNEMSRNKYDVFISHASADKIEFVDKLYESINKLGVRIFYDDKELSWGDSIKDLILNGTAISEFAIIVISNNFFGREWTERELHEFLIRQNEVGKKIILPLLHNISIMKFIEHYPHLSDIKAYETTGKSCDEIALFFAKELIKRIRNQ